MSTYNVTLTTLTHHPKVTISFDIEEKDFNSIAIICRSYFPSVEIIDVETGELILRYYNSRQKFYHGGIGGLLNKVDPYIIKPEVQ